MSKSVEKVSTQSKDIFAQELAKFSQIFPQFVSEGKVDFDALKKFLEDKNSLADEKDKYTFSWAGKDESFKAISRPSYATLNPKPDESVDFDNTENLFIEGDNLEVLKLLQTHYHGKIKMIYIDPPYNTGNDFIYKDNFKEGKSDYFERIGTTKNGIKLETNSDDGGRYHSQWLSMMYPRLFLAKQLLADDGVIFISIDDHEQHHLKMLMNEVFGEDNFIECISWNKRIPKNDKGIGNIHEYINIYSKNSSHKHQFIMEKEGLDDIYNLLKKLKKSNIGINNAEIEIKKLYKKQGYDRGITLYNSLDKNYRLWGKINMSWPNANTFGSKYIVPHPKTKKPVKCPERGWRWKLDTFNEVAHRIDGEYQDMHRLDDGSYICGGIWFSSDENIQPSSITYLDDVNEFLLRYILSLKSDGGIEVEKIFDNKNYFSYPKPTKLLKILLSSCSLKNNNIVLDFFAGSATTGHAVMDLNKKDGAKRKFILVQIPESIDEKSEAFKAGYKIISDISKDRLRKAIEKNDYKDGFKVFSLAPTNYNIAKDYDGDDEQELLQQEISFTQQPLIDNFEPINLVYEIILKQGFSLNSKIKQQDDFYIVEDAELERKLVITLTNAIDTGIIEALKLDTDDILVCLDTALTDTQKINFSRNFKLRVI
ncbi:Type III restriction-modification system methylation subunit [Bathymodiolus heckerae thiotrophic gill symbiont]|uniref:site-specific DNA-methyltransferase n=1 Tax=Bathymodiolus heckerae thiotrophic gill symbiont TaxID=1052212 RepID=UPI0010B8A26F|nr:site-specific DNA-methyltransferase [Bathymodiolus heckerae thiotrophic gill symbiont]SHN90259.1 Type III restriction-modification system methylation subunit [Bathymodiolus heckerae thiotrophic gill symbiont]